MKWNIYICECVCVCVWNKGDEYIINSWLTPYPWQTNRTGLSLPAGKHSQGSHIPCLWLTPMIIAWTAIKIIDNRLISYLVWWLFRVTILQWWQISLFNLFYTCWEMLIRSACCWILHQLFDFYLKVQGILPLKEI